MLYQYRAVELAHIHQQRPLIINASKCWVVAFELRVGSFHCLKLNYNNGISSTEIHFVNKREALTQWWEFRSSTARIS